MGALPALSQSSETREQEVAAGTLMALAQLQ